MKKYKMLMLAVSLLILLAVVAYSNPLLIAEKLAGSDYRFIAGAFVLSLFGVSLGVLKWKILLKGVGYLELYPVQVLGYAISNFTPAKAGEPAKAVLLKMRSGVAVSSSLPSIMWERIMDVTVLIILSMVVMGSISLNSAFFLPVMFGMVVFIIVVFMAILVLYNKNFGNRVFGIVRRLPLLKRLPENFMVMFYENRISRGRVIKAFMLAFVTWVVIGLCLYSTLLAFGYELNPLILSGVAALSLVVGIASSLPGGIGTTEIIMIFLLGVLGVDSGTAAAATITFRLATIWFVNILGGLCFIYLSRKMDLKKL